MDILVPRPIVIKGEATKGRDAVLELREVVVLVLDNLKPHLALGVAAYEG